MRTSSAPTMRVTKSLGRSSILRKSLISLGAARLRVGRKRGLAPIYYYGVAAQELICRTDLAKDVNNSTSRCEADRHQNLLKSWFVTQRIKGGLGFKSGEEGVVALRSRRLERS